jgi:hypothetical protein
MALSRPTHQRVTPAVSPPLVRERDNSGGNMNKKIALSKKSRRTPDELKQGSKHIFWGMRYLSERLEFFSRFSNKYNAGEIAGLLNSIHDSFLIHARKMTEFLYNTSNLVYDDDLIADDYFDDPHRWRMLRPAMPNVLEGARKDVGKLLVHFTYQVKAYPTGRIWWETSDVYVAIFAAFQKFLSEADRSLLYEELDYLREENRNIMICYPIYPPKAKPPYQIVCRRDKASGLYIAEEG